MNASRIIEFINLILAVSNLALIKLYGVDNPLPPFLLGIPTLLLKTNSKDS